MEEKNCTESHAEHICAMVQKDEFAAIKRLVNNPNFMCSNCGRFANEGKNLCNPFPFKQISPGTLLE